MALIIWEVGGLQFYHHPLLHSKKKENYSSVKLNKELMDFFLGSLLKDTLLYRSYICLENYPVRGIHYGYFLVRINSHYFIGIL